MQPLPLPLFPLGMVLYPGSLLPLHVFEDRYRRMVTSLLEQAEGRRRFGVVAIKAGREAWDDGSSDIYEIGCTAVLQRVEAYRDGRFDLLCIGESRIRVENLDTSSDLLRGTAQILPDTATQQAPALAGRVGQLFRKYLSAMQRAGWISSDDDTDDELPPHPTALSFFVADGMILDLTDKQSLLAAGTTDERLTLELEFLRRESAMLRQFSTRPAVELLRAPYSTN